MKGLYRALACWFLILLLPLTGCSALHGVFHADEPDAADAEKDALWQQMLSDRPSPETPKGPVLTIVFIDVGQGDCTLLISPEGNTMLVDAGPVGSFPAIASVLNRYGADALDVVVATHPHADHIGAMADVLDAYPVGMFYTIDYGASLNEYADMIDSLAYNGCPVRFCETMTTIPWAESCTVTVLNPNAAYDAPDDLNDASVVLRVAYGDTAVLLTGDAGEVAERRMLDTFPRSMLRANVLKLGHHGSRYSTGFSFFLAVSPDFAAVSCGKGNEYGHPHIETLSLLYETRTACYRTDLDGTITMYLNGTDVTVAP